MTILEFQRVYSSDDICLDEIFQNRYGHVDHCPSCGSKTKFYRIKKRKCYKCSHCAFELNPLAGTIFHKSSTPLTKWFFAVYLFSQARNGVAAKELQRHLGVTYKCAWRMARQIRLLMSQNKDKLDGIVEADETYIGGVGKMEQGRSNKTIVLGAVERGGEIRAELTHTTSRITVERFLKKHLTELAKLYTDESPVYIHAGKERVHKFITHSKGEYAKHGISTNTIEGFWGQMKRSLDGTYHSVSRKHLQLYVDEFVYRYNHRQDQIFPLMIAAAVMPVE